MNIVYSDAHSLHQPKFELYDGQSTPYAEVAARVDSILAALPPDSVQAPDSFPIDHILAIHSQGYVDFLRRKSQAIPDGEQIYPSYFLSDTYAPITRGTYKASIAAVNTTLTGAQQLIDSEPAVYCLCRPPGHHASHHSMGGYCYFNNAAIAAQYLSQQGRVAVLDIDYHHGNGTQSAFYDRSDVLYVSLHADPTASYPYTSGFADETGAGAGEGFTLNFPLPSDTNNNQYLDTLGRAIHAIEQFQPDFLVVSAGFDTYAEDPIGGMSLDKDVYTQIGHVIHDLGLPTLIIQEGGYDTRDLGLLVTNFLLAFR